MRKEYGGSPKPHQLESKRKKITWILGISGLCILFYILGAMQTTAPLKTSEAYSKNNCTTNSVNNERRQSSTSATTLSSAIDLDFDSHHEIALKDNKTVVSIPPCDMSLSEYTPCQYPPRGRMFDRNMLKYRERHCPSKEELLHCLIPAPPNYKTPFKWPQSRDYAWYDNIPHKELSIEKAIQNWIQVDGQRFRFPGGGTMFPHGADKYIDDIAQLIPLTDGAIRTAIDTGCGVSKNEDKLTCFCFVLYYVLVVCFCNCVLG